MSSGAISAELAAPTARGAWGGDERLAGRVTSGDARAFATLYERYHQRLFRYCVSILRDENDAADALQSTFERAFAALRRDQRNAPLRPWLFRIAHNEAITVIRRRTPESGAGYIGPPAARSAAHEADERGRLSTLVADLAELPERSRSALVMRELEGLSHEDIAIALDTSMGAAKQAIFDARRALSEAAEGREMSCEEIRRLISDGDRRVLRGRRLRAHLRDCRGCTEFAKEIPRRSAQLRALAPPLAPVAAASILARASGGLAGHGARGGLSTAGAGGLGKGGLAAAVGSKVAVGAAVVATATVGTAGVAVIEPLVVAHRAPKTGAAPARSAVPVSHVSAGGSGVVVVRQRPSATHVRSASHARQPGSRVASAPASRAGHGRALGRSETSILPATSATHSSHGRAVGQSQTMPAASASHGASSQHAAASTSHGASSQHAAAGRAGRSNGTAVARLRHSTGSANRSTHSAQPANGHVGGPATTQGAAALGHVSHK